MGKRKHEEMAKHFPSTTEDKRKNLEDVFDSANKQITELSQKLIGEKDPQIRAQIRIHMGVVSETQRKTLLELDELNKNRSFT